MSVPPGVELDSLSIFVHDKISNVLIFGAPAPLVGEIDSGTFLYEIQFRTIFIWNFFYILLIFGITEPQSESNFPFLCIIKF